VEYLSILRARWMTVVAVILVALALAGFVSLRATPVYVARANVFFSVSISGSTSDLARGFAYAQGQVRSYAKVATQPIVLQPVIDQLGLDMTPVQLSRSIVAQSPLDTVLLEIQVSESDPERAADIANAVATQLTAAVTRLTAPTATQSPVKVTTVQPAAVPKAPESPRTKVNLAIALFLGTIAGAVGAVARDTLDQRIAGRREVARVTEAPVIGTISPHRRTLLPERLRRRVIRGEPTRELRTNFQHVCGGNGLRTVLFCSAADDTATSLTVSELGEALSDTGVNTLLIDADVRRPSLARRHDGSDVAGLTSVVAGDMPWRAAVHMQHTRLGVMSAGPTGYDPSGLLDLSSMSDLLSQAAADYDLVLVKAPPVLLVADGLVLSRLTDGVVVVTDQRSMHRELLSSELEALELAGANVVGVVLVR
jgi:succinoglycan biosynthesis transport protein ExoP